MIFMYFPITYIARSVIIPTQANDFNTLSINFLFNLYIYIYIYININ